MNTGVNDSLKNSLNAIQNQLHNMRGVALSTNSSGNQVNYLKGILKGYFSLNLGTGNTYNFETKTAVQAVQQLGGLTQDGVCGRNTWEKIIRFLPERSRISHELQILQKSIMNPPVIPDSGNVDDNDTTESIEQILKSMEEEFALMLPFIPDEVNVASVEEFKEKYGYYFIGPFSESARINMENGNYLVDRIWKWVNGIDDETYAQYGVELFGGIRSALQDSGLESLKDEIRDIDSVYKNLPTNLDTMAFWQARVIGEAMVSGEMSLKGTADTIMIAFGVVAGAKGIVSVAKSSGVIIAKIKPILSNMPKKSANLKQSLLKLRSKMQGFRYTKEAMGRRSIRTLTDIADSEIASRVKQIRSLLPSDLRTGGNLATAKVEISGLKNNFYAHNRINVLENARSAADSVKDISLKPTNPIFKASNEVTSDGRIVFRDIDSEFKIINDLASKLGGNVNSKGKVQLFTELAPCPSCENVILEFLKKYKNITIEIIHNNGTRLIP